VSFIETVRRARELLREEGRISMGALKLEFDLDDALLEALIEELVDVQQVAARDGKILSWMGAGATPPSSMEPESREALEPPGDAAPARSEAEHRQLTVLFCDLVDSTGLSGRLDAETLREVVQSYQERASEVIGRYEGHIAQYLGDGLLVYFGYPQAHEDDAERAVRAGREIPDALALVNERLERELDVQLEVRVGIHTGAVVVGEMGRGERRETLALGDTTNIAARLQGEAEPDAVVISDATLRLVPGLFVTEDLGVRNLKGLAGQIRAYRVLQPSGVRSRLEVVAKLTPLLGREQELGLLLDRWELVEDGEGQAVLLSGEAGIGKSRLLHSVRERVADTPHSWLECQSTPYTRNTAFHPMIELVEQGCGFKEQDPPDVKLRRLETGLRLSGLRASELVPLLAPLLSVPLPESYAAPTLSPELQRKQTIEALVAWTLALGERQPVVILFEDLHWSDPSTLELVGLLLKQIPTARVLALLAFRPEFEPPWSMRSHVTPISIGRLRRRTVSQMISAIAGGRALPDPVVERIVERAGGIPLYVEELTKTVLESGLLAQREGHYELTGELDALAIPTTLQDSLMARLDRLAAAKEVAQLGAAIGREFSYELLAAVAELDEPTLLHGLGRLVDAELLYRRGAPPAATYTFKHTLIQETAYQSLLRSVRQPLHGRIAKVLEERFPERAVAEPEVLARHYEGADLAAPAAACYERAGSIAAERSANEEATRLLGRGLELLATLPDSRERNRQELEMQLTLGSCRVATQGYGHDHVERAYGRARELCREVEEPGLLSRALVGSSLFHFCRADLETAADLGRQILALGERTGDDSIELTGHVILGLPLVHQGRFTEALEHFERALSLYDPSQFRSLSLTYGQDMGVTAWGYSALALSALGYPGRSEERMRGAAELARTGDHPYSLAWALTVSACISQMQRRLDKIPELAEELIALTQRQAFAFLLGAGRALRGYAHALSIGAEEGATEYREGMALTASTGAQFWATAFLAIGGEAYAAVGAPERALRSIEGAFTVSEKNGERFWDAELHRAKGEVLLAMNDNADEQAEPLFERALEIARDQEARLFELRTATSLARLWQRQGRKAEARNLLAPVYDWFTEGFDTQDLVDAKTLLGELS
jgi:class 3 adenylate cyclase/predicted ATPase